MKTKMLLIAVMTVVVAGAIFYFKNQIKKAAPQDDSAGLIVGKNAIYVAEQAPGQSIIVSVVHFEKPGFIVIHEDSSGTPGKILGASNLLPAGETKNLLPITLSRATTNNETVYAMLHFDNDDGKFNAADDKPTIDPVGNEPVMMVVVVNEDALGPGAVNP